MKVQFPHASGYAIDAEDFLRAWVDFYSKKKSKFKFDDPIPCLASAATLNDLKEKKHDFDDLEVLSKVWSFSLRIKD